MSELRQEEQNALAPKSEALPLGGRVITEGALKIKNINVITGQ